jgi:hypothetical protein
MTDTATKFHITKKGAVEPCDATVKACPLGGQHFESEDDAQDYLAFEAAAEKKAAFQREYKALELMPTAEGEEIEIKDRWGQKQKVVVGRKWLIKNSSGQVIGGLEYRMVAKEQRRSDNPRARRRWMAPGWVYYNGSGDVMERKLTIQSSSKKAALESMLRHAQERAVEA